MTEPLPDDRFKDGKIFCPLVGPKGKWLDDKPEERVRQRFIEHLRSGYGYEYGQMRQEQKTVHGHRSPRVDIAVWATPEAASETPRPAPVLVVECKAESVDIHPRDFYQGRSYAAAVGAPCEYLVMHNERQTAFYRVERGLPVEFVQVNDIPRAGDWGDAARLRALRENLREFGRKEFQNLLHKCHGILRDNHKMEPGRAFDAISKILFVKMYVERTGTHGTFTTAFLNQRKQQALPGEKPVHEQLFDLTKQFYRDDEIFAADDSLDVSEATFRRIVQELERFNLSATGDDIKGLAFERFLGDTFRGNLGQYFTPRPVVDFMVDVLDPDEGDLICDPAAGSGGFLIRAFEHVRDKIEADVQAQKDEAREAVEALGLDEDEEVRRVEAAFAELNRQLDPDVKEPPSRIRRLSREYVYGTDAEARAARTAKMNMIMHGDGHGGIHYHDGLVDVNGIFPGRFDVVLSNPPFGSTVGDDQIVGETEQTRGPFDASITRRAKERYGEAWTAANEAFLTAKRDGERSKNGTLPVLNLYDIGLGKGGQKTELLFLERCLRLLKPGGRLGVVLPDGNLNNPSAQWADVRRWAEGKARLMAVVSLPLETFKGAGTHGVKASVVFMQRFTASDDAEWEAAWDAAHGLHDGPFDAERDAAVAEHAGAILTGGDAAVRHLLDALDEAGGGMTEMAWKRETPPPYPRGVVSTSIVNAKWRPLPKGTAKEDANRLRAEVRAAWTDAHEAEAKRAAKALRRDLRRIDAAHRAALWEAVREAFDYPVFTAAPETVGVTSTGDAGPSELPAVLADWRAFRAWVASGAAEDEMPAFGVEA